MLQFVEDLFKMNVLDEIRYHSPGCVRLRYYLRNIASLALPRRFYQVQFERWASELQRCADPSVFERALYYNKICEPFSLSGDATCFAFDLARGQSSYQFDLQSVLRYFPSHRKVQVQFGDVCETPAIPTIVKSRPIGAGNANAVLFKLNSIRHFYFVKDPYAFREKREMLVWRGRACQQNRKEFLAAYYEHPLCDVGHYHSRHQDVVWTKPELSVREQLQYKYILAMEGNDVATNLKWVLSSNSLCFMTKPQYETWFMEGLLEPGKHYVLLRDDYADLEEKILYYNVHPDEASGMISAAHEWVKQFQDPVSEMLVSMLVLWRYFFLTGQMDVAPPLPLSALAPAAHGGVRK